MEKHCSQPYRVSSCRYIALLPSIFIFPSLPFLNDVQKFLSVLVLLTRTIDIPCSELLIKSVFRARTWIIWIVIKERADKNLLNSFSRPLLGASRLDSKGPRLIEINHSKRDVTQLLHIATKHTLHVPGVVVISPMQRSQHMAHRRGDDGCKSDQNPLF